MKLIIQIPCYNEEATLAATLAALPRTVPGFDVVEWLIVDDGSTDGTVEVARRHGVDHVVGFTRNRGLARAFVLGLDACLARGADVIVNTDADNQYVADDIPLLVAPIIEGRAEMVIGARPIGQIAHFSPAKKLLQGLGSWVVRRASRTEVADAPSGFRAISKAAALQLNVFTEYTYTLETIVQAGQKNLTVVSVPIRTNPGRGRPSRLVRSTPSYVWRSVTTIFRLMVVYRPLQFFSAAALLPGVVGLGLCLRWLYLFAFVDPTRSRAPSLILAAILLVIAALLFALGLIGEQLAVNRKLLEELQLRLRKADAQPARGGEQGP